MSWRRWLGIGAAAVVGVAIADGAVNLNRFRSDAPADRSGEVAAEARASSCESSGFYIRNRLDGSKTLVYDCVVRGSPMCVTEDGGLASDSTETVRLLFAGTLGGRRPACLG